MSHHPAYYDKRPIHCISNGEPIHSASCLTDCDLLSFSLVVIISDAFLTFGTANKVAVGHRYKDVFTALFTKLCAIFSNI